MPFIIYNSFVDFELTIRLSIFSAVFILAGIAESGSSLNYYISSMYYLIRCF